MTDTHTRRSRYTTALLACIVSLSMLAGGMPAAMAGGGDDVNADSVHALEDGEDLYLVFGADLDGMSLEEYIDAHASEGASADGASQSEVIQYQDVDQVNVNEQGDAVSISIDGGEATAIQEADQLNANAQTGEATAESETVSTHETQFENVGNVYLVMGDGGTQQFNGWGIAGDDEKKDDKEIITQAAEAGVTQTQDVAQGNYNNQSTAFAFAAENSEATALQETTQSNRNLQEGAANASNVYVGDGEYADQSANAWLTQMQAVEQVNVNEQGGAVAIAVGEGSTATAIQLTEQTNLNEQLGSAEAISAVAAMDGMNVATAGGESSAVHTETPSDGKKDKDDSQTATAAVDQEQAVEQLNVNLQNTAMAIATNESESTAVQIAHQQNYNAQIGYADAINVYAAPGYNYDTAVKTSSTTVTVGGDSVEGAPGMSYDYDTAANQTNTVTQEATAALEQTQFVTQENINEQHAAVAVAEDGGSANAAQVSMQENENVQFSAVAATNIWITP